MKDKVLINLFDIHNEASLLAIEKIRPYKVIYIVDKSLEGRFTDILEYETKRFKSVIFESLIVDRGDINKIIDILSNYKIDDIIINLTGGERINSLILLNECLNRGIEVIYVDVLHKEWYTFGKSLRKSVDEFKDIKLEDIVNIAGTNIVTDSTELSDKFEVVEIVKQIYKHLDIWYKYKFKLYDNSIFIHDESDNNRIYVNLNNVNIEEMDILNRSLEYLHHLKCINYIKINKKIQIDFLKEVIRSFIFKSGTWLEVLTEIIIKEIEEIDEVKSGVVFLWNESKKKVRNELDVLAVKDSILICISCKDSEKYDEDALNELDVYSKRLGGSLAKKILVATKKPCKECVIDRARIMGISLVILEDDIEKFKDDLKRAINK